MIIVSNINLTNSYAVAELVLFSMSGPTKVGHLFDHLLWSVSIT